MAGFRFSLDEPEAGVLSLALSGDVDLGTAPALRDAIRTAIESGSYRCLAFDLSDLRFIDSSGLHVLIEGKRRMSQVRGDIRIVHAPPHVERLLEVTGLHGLLNVTPDRATAAAA